MEQKPFIENCSYDDVCKAWHYYPGPNAAIIQIVDPDMDHPIPKWHFQNSLKEKFLDLDEDHPMAIQFDQAERIAKFLKQCLEKRQNVIVHCVAGVCRSGAVVDVGVSIGFRDTEKVRIPNILVKQKIMSFI